MYVYILCVCVGLHDCARLQRLLLLVLNSEHVDMASNQVKLLRLPMGREIGHEQLNAAREQERERGCGGEGESEREENVFGSSSRTQLYGEHQLASAHRENIQHGSDLYYIRSSHHKTWISFLFVDRGCSFDFFFPRTYYWFLEFLQAGAGCKLSFRREASSSTVQAPDESRKEEPLSFMNSARDEAYSKQTRGGEEVLLCGRSSLSLVGSAA